MAKKRYLKILIIMLLLGLFLIGCQDSQEITKIYVKENPTYVNYYEGESFNKEGMKIMAVYKDNSEREISLYTIDKTLLETKDTFVTISYQGFTCSVEIYVQERTIQDDYYNTLAQYVSNSDAQVRDFYTSSVSYENMLPQLFESSNIISREQLIKCLEYNAFYNIEKFDITINYNFNNVDEELNYVYWNSNYFVGNIGLDYTEKSSNEFTIILNYYNNNKYNSLTKDRIITNPYIISLQKVDVVNKRSQDYQFPTLQKEINIDVYNSTQLEYALANGYGVNIIASSPAEKVYNKIRQILIECVSDDMNLTQKIRQIYGWFLENCQYDETAEEVAGFVSGDDQEKHADMYASFFVSFYADGPLLYNIGVCHGFARAYNLLLLVEGIKAIRTVGKRTEATGRSSILLINREVVYYNHGYNYIEYNNEWYLSDITYAYAGEVNYNGQKIGMFRNCALLISKNFHENIYINLVDPFSPKGENVYDYLLETSSGSEAEFLPTLNASTNYEKIIQEINKYSVCEATFIISNNSGISDFLQYLTTNNIKYYYFVSEYINNTRLLVMVFV